MDVREVLGVPPLVASQGDSVCVLLNNCVDHIQRRAIVREMNHLGALRLDQPAHYVDGGIVPIEQGRGCDDAGKMLGLLVRVFWGCSLRHGAHSL